MHSQPNCPECGSKLLSNHVPNTYLCKHCNIMYELNKDNELNELEAK